LQFKDGTCNHDTARKLVFEKCELTSVEYQPLTYSKRDPATAILHFECATVVQPDL